ncbi:ATP-binding protein [Mucilaginibacter sp.]
MAKNQSTVIGKDVIESLTTSMYDDSRFIFREYIQNSADQIDKAVRENLQSIQQSEIHIQIDTDRRLITIEDNATGVAAGEVSPILKNIAQSTKKRGVDKGFRGIGRLGGMAYCDQLVFETSFPGETVKSVMTWDAAKLRKIINNRNEKEEASQVIDEVTSIETFPEEAEAHYFKVTLKDVSHDELLDVTEVRRYLSMVAPVAFHPRFIYRGKISDELLADNIKLDEYNLYVNTEQVFKGYSTYIYEGDQENRRKIGEVVDVLFFKERDEEGKLVLWGWYGITEKNQSLNQINYARGFRLRKANIQVGDEYSLIKLHRDRRFQFYFFGEVYVIHPDILPNARRDYFIENEAYFEFEDKLKNFLHNTIHKLCYAASEINSSVKRIEEYNSFQQEFQQKNLNGFTDKGEHQEYTERLSRKKDEAIKAEVRLEKLATGQSGENSPIRKILDRIMTAKQSKIESHVAVKEDAKPKFRTDKLTKLNKEQRKFLSDVFRIIKNVLPNDVAENLIIKIEEEMK